MAKRYILTIELPSAKYTFNIHDAPGDFRIVANLPDGTSIMGSDASRLLDALLVGPGKVYGYRIVETDTIVVPVDAKSWKPRPLSEINPIEARRIGVLFAPGIYKIVVEAQSVSDVAGVKSFGDVVVEEFVEKLVNSRRTAVAVDGILASALEKMLFLSGDIYDFHKILIKPKSKRYVTVFDAGIRPAPIKGILIKMADSIGDSISSSGDLGELYKLKYGYIFLMFSGEKEVVFSAVAHAKAARAVKHFAEMLVSGVVSQYGYAYRRIKLPTKT